MASAGSLDAPVAVIGGGVVGCAVAYALASRGAELVLLEAEPELGLGASGTNSGILHTGFDQVPGRFETGLILRSAELRDRVLAALGVPVRRCGARLLPFSEEDARQAAALADRAAANRVPVIPQPDGALDVPGETVTDPVAFTLALGRAAAAATADVRTGARVEAIERGSGGFAISSGDGSRVRCRVAVNCAGLFADEVARMAGDESFDIYPRKGEFFVFEPTAEPPDRILLPVPTARRGVVLVFPTVDGKVIAGPSAHDQDDKGDWSVRPRAAEELLPTARRVLPALEGAEPIAAYAGLRPAGRGVNYLIGPSDACPGLINVAAIRSSGLTAALGIGELVCRLVAEQGVELGPDRPLEAPADTDAEARGPWWQRTARQKMGLDSGGISVR